MEINFKEVAAQLRQPHGEFGKQVGENMNRSNAWLYNKVIGLMHVRPSDHILEIGMGNGLFCKDILALAPDVKYTGADLSAVMTCEAEISNRAFVDAGQAKFVMADAAALPFPDHTFNTVLSINTIYFWDNATLVLDEVFRILKPQGSFMIGLRTEESMRTLPFVQYGFKTYNKKTLSALLERGGFALADIAEYEEPEQVFNGGIIKMTSLIAGVKKVI